MTRSRLTIRVRLTLLYTGLFAVCGAIVVAITYALVWASLPKTPVGSVTPAEFLNQCRLLPKNGVDPATRYKCDAAFREGVTAGASSQRDLTLAHLLQYSVITLVAVTILAALAGWIVAGRALRPVHQITAAARTASEHNLSARVALTGPRDELRELADTFDEMLGRLQAAFEGQQRFIANASHELRTPLTVMRATVDVVLAKPKPAPPELLGMGLDIRVAVDQAEALVNALLTLAQTEHRLAVREEVDLATIAEDVLDSVDPGDLRVHTSLQPAPSSGDPVLMARVISNLVENAVRYNIPDGDVWLATSSVDGQAVIEVINTGPIIAPSMVDGLFEPFRRLRDRTSGDGFGLGLAIVASIVAAHSATVVARPRPEGGLKVTVAMSSDRPAPCPAGVTSGRPF